VTMTGRGRQEGGGKKRAVSTPNGPNDAIVIWAHSKLFFHLFLVFLN
jgi:hypothetical protein